MPAISLYRRIVRAEEIDPLGHANNVAYVQWMQEAAIAHSTAQGWSMARYRELEYAWVVRRHAIEYLAPVVVGAEVTIVTWIASMARVSSVRRFRFYCGGGLVARSETNWAFIRTGDGRPVRVPQPVVEAFVVLGDDFEPPALSDAASAEDQCFSP